MRRAPIPEVGAHRPETVAGRLASELATNVTHFSALEGRMAANLDDTLARLDAIVAKANDVKQAAEADVAAQVEERVAALEAVLGITPDQPTEPGV